MDTYQSPSIVELGSIAEFTRGDRFAFAFDGMSLAEAIETIINGQLPPIGTS